MGRSSTTQGGAGKARCAPCPSLGTSSSAANGGREQAKQAQTKREDFLRRFAKLRTTISKGRNTHHAQDRIDTQGSIRGGWRQRRRSHSRKSARRSNQP